MRVLLWVFVGILLICGSVAAVMHIRAKNQRQDEQTYHAALRKTVAVTSRSFPPNGDMPINCSCKGQEASPALMWEGDQPHAESYVVLMTDYDVPTPVFPIYNLSHWVIYNLPASVRSLPEGLSVEQMRMLGGKTGKNSTGDLTYIGPCPPVGRHAYVFRVYALDELLTFSSAPDKQAVLDAMKGHVLAYGELTGYFR
ncbi:YbhB/YbcL family Raf kinase inhibitor-like protein [Spirosoma fluminis]